MSDYSIAESHRRAQEAYDAEEPEYLPETCDECGDQLLDEPIGKTTYEGPVRIVRYLCGWCAEELG